MAVSFDVIELNLMFLQVLDVGCGIGGPYRNIARFTGWDVTGITLNQYQVRRLVVTDTID